MLFRSALDTFPTVVGDQNIVRGNQLPGAGFTDDDSYALEDCAIRSTFVSEKEDHWAAGGEVALVGGIDYMLAQAAILEITEEFGMQLGVVPFARRGEC